MGRRVNLQTNYIRVSRPGIDVDTAAEKDLLISLNARSAQIIARGFIAQPAPTNVISGVGTYTYNIYFPAQNTAPDMRACVLTAGDVNLTERYEAYPPEQTVTFGTSSAQVVFRGSTGELGGSTSYIGLQYIVFRKRLDS